MAEIKKTVADVKPVASIKTPVVAEVKKEEAPAKKPAVKKAAAKPAAKKPAVKKAAATTAKKPAVKKAETKKAAAKKPAAKKAAVAAPVVKTNIVLQYADKSVTYDTLIENAQNVIQYDMGKTVADIKKLDLYVKPEENTVYFVVNDKEHNQYGL